MPLNIDFLQILLHILNFLILFGGLTLLLFKPITDFLNKRTEYFRNAEQEIKEKQAANELLKSELEEKIRLSSEEIDDMRLKAEKEIAEISKSSLTHAKEKADAIILAAEKEAEDRKEHILDAAQTEIGELVVSATQKLLSDTVTPERNSALYDEFIRLADKTIIDKRASK